MAQTQQTSKSEDLIRQTFAALNSTAPKAAAAVTSPELSANLANGHAQWHRDFSAVKWELTNVVAAADKVGFSYEARGTHKKAGRELHWSGSGVARVSDGKIVEIALNEDWWARELQLGHIPGLATDSITGIWKGSVFQLPFEADLKQGTGTAVTGQFKILGLHFPVTGTNAYPNVELHGKEPGGKPVVFKGKWVGSNEIKGEVEGIAKDVVLTRHH